MIQIAPPVSTTRIPMAMLPALVMEEGSEVHVFSDTPPHDLGIFVMVRAKHELFVTEYELKMREVVHPYNAATREEHKNEAWVLKQHVDTFRMRQTLGHPPMSEAARRRAEHRGSRTEVWAAAKKAVEAGVPLWLFTNTIFGKFGCGDVQKIPPPLDQRHLVLPDGSLVPDPEGKLCQALMDHTKQEAQRLGLRVSSDPPVVPYWEANYCTEDARVTCEAFETFQHYEPLYSPNTSTNTFTPKNLIDVQTFIRTALAEGQPIPREWLDRALGALDALFYTGDELLRRAHAERYGVPLEQVGVKKRFRYTPSAAEEKRIENEVREAARTIARGRGVDAERLKFGKAHGLAVECYVEQFVRPDIMLADANVWLMVYWELDKSSLVVDDSENAVTKLGIELWMETLEGTTHPEVIGERAVRRDADGAEFWMEYDFSAPSKPPRMIAKDLASKSVDYVSAYPAEMLAKKGKKK